MTAERDAEYVKSEALELISAAVENGFIEYVGFHVTDGVLEAETYTDDGEIVAQWVVEITVTQKPAVQDHTGGRSER